MKAKPRRPYVPFLTAIICLVGVSGLSQVSFSSPKGNTKLHAHEDGTTTGKAKTHTHENSARTPVQVPCGCPLFPIMTEGDNTLFYGDYFPTCSENVEATYLFLDNDHPWPYTVCDEHPCMGGHRAPFLDDVEPLEDFVPEDYTHQDQNPAPNRIIIEDDNHFVKMQIPDKPNRHGKVLKFKVTRIINGKFEEHIRYVAFEVEREPEGQVERKKSLMTEQRRLNKYLYRGRTEVVDSDEEPAPKWREVLFWLHTEDPETAR